MCKAGINSVLEVNGLLLETDEDGYLRHLDDWSPAVAAAIAGQENLQLSQAHWEIIHLARDFYNTYQLPPAMRPLVKYTAITLGADKGRSIYLMQLFAPSPAKLVSKIAGLPRPTNCL